MQPAASPGSAAHPDRPRFRQDLIAEPIDEQGARFIDVMDPESGNLFRFYDVEYALACGMDGERDVSGIVRWAQEELGLTPSPQEVRAVIATLSDLGFIDGGAHELAPGVVAAAPARAPAAAGVDLGTAGGVAAAAGPMPRAPDLTLGAPGAAARRPAEPVEDVPLGAPGRGRARITPSPAQSPAAAASAVSTDLADQFAVRAADVQEAVRASKVMAAVDPALLDTLEDRPAAKPAQLERPDMRPPEARVEARDARVGKPPLTRQPSAKLPVELPRPPALAPAAPPVPELPAPAPAPTPSRVSPFLVMLLIIAVIAAGAYLVWKYVLDRPVSEVGAVTPQVTPPAPPAPAPPPPPPAPVAKIVMDVPSPEEIKSPRAGVIETILADNIAVKAGDVVIKLVGDKPIEAELSGLARDQKRLQDQIDTFTKRRDAAQAAGNKAAAGAMQVEIDTRQKTLAGKAAQLAAKTMELDKFLIHASGNGTFAPSAKLGQKVAAGEVIATIQRDATPVATFKVSDTRPFAPNAPIEIALGKGELRVPCTIAAVQPETVTIKVACPVDPALTDGTEVTLKVPATAPAASGTPGPSGASGAPAGSAGEPPSAAPGGPGAGSAEPPPGGSAAPAAESAPPAGAAEPPAAPATTPPK